MAKLCRVDPVIAKWFKEIRQGIPLFDSGYYRSDGGEPDSIEVEEERRQIAFEGQIERLPLGLKRFRCHRLAH